LYKEEKGLKENSLSGADLDIEIQYVSLEFFCKELNEENILSEFQLDFVKKPL